MASRCSALVAAMLAAAGSGAAVANGAPVDVSGVGDRPRILKIVRPEYPAQAASGNVSGLVRVDVVVRADGYAEKITYAPDGPASAMFVESLQRVTREWKFAPLLGDDCYPVPTRFTAEVAFEMDQGQPRIFVTPIGKPRHVAAALAHQRPVRQERPSYPWEREGIGVASATFVAFTVDREGNVTSAKARSFTPQRAPAESSDVARAMERVLEDMGPFNRATELSVMDWKFPPVPPAMPAPWSGCWEMRFPGSY
jgi:TonB family protein